MSTLTILVVMIVGEMCNGPPPEIVRSLEAADAAYGSHGMPVKRDKSEDPALTADFWGATLHGGSGRYGFNLERRASLAATTLFALAFGMSSGDCWVSGPSASASVARVDVRPRNCLSGRAINASPAADHALWTGVQRGHVACLSSGHSSRRICAPTPPAIARADPSSLCMHWSCCR